MIKRLKSTLIESALAKRNKIILVYGARQVGKSTMINKLLDEYEGKALRINADETRYHQVLSSRDAKALSNLVDGYDLLFIDEAQRIPDIGINLKILYETLPELKIIITGSSSIDLASNVSEPLTGRVKTFKMHPLSLQELRVDKNLFEINESMEEFLLYGLYPEVYTIDSIRDKESHLREITSSYLYKDILQLTSIRNSSKLYKLLQLLALQISSTVSINKLSNELDMSLDTVNSYIDLLEQSFVLYRLSGYSNNPRKEISKMDKILFCDVGIRNALIDNFTPWHLRQDKGALWENFVINERIKLHDNAENHVRSHFWRTYNGTEIDLIETHNDNIAAYEIKNKSNKKRPPGSWAAQYPDSSYEVIQRSNWQEYLV